MPHKDRVDWLSVCECCQLHCNLEGGLGAMLYEHARDVQRVTAYWVTVSCDGTQAHLLDSCPNGTRNHQGRQCPAVLQALAVWKDTQAQRRRAGEGVGRQRLRMLPGIPARCIAE